MQERSRAMIAEEEEWRTNLENEEHEYEEQEEPLDPVVAQKPPKESDKPTTATKKKEKKKSWTWCHDQIVKLIPLWEDEPCLYKTTSADYKDKDKRLNALVRIKTKMEEAGIEGLTVDDISNKLH